MNIRYPLYEGVYRILTFKGRFCYAKIRFSSEKNKISLGFIS